VLRYATAAEAHHTHPIARAIQEAAATRGLTLPSIEDARYEMGYGIKVDIDGHCVRVGSARFLALEGMTLSSELQEVQQANHVQGHSLVFVAIDDQVGGALSLHATLRPEARRILRQLRRRHLQLYIISGDHHQPTTQLAATLGIDHVFAETLPDEKATLIARLQQEGKTVCFVGDGINDAMALKQADVSVSLRGASTVATDTAQLLLMDQSLNQLGHLFEVAEQFNTNMKINMAAALVPGFLCIGGVFILHLGLFSASMLYNLSIVTGLGNAMRPRLRSAWDQRQEHQQPSSGTLSALLTSGA
jgi:Cu2+-exporting ATPase